MATINKKLTADIAAWLNTPTPERDVNAGATLLLSLNRNRILYNTIIRNPKKMMAKLERELTKFLRIRLDNQTGADIISLEAAVLPAAAQMIETAAVISTDDELPAGTVAKGKRPDHDLLPYEIKGLWAKNSSLIKKISILFNELKAMEDMQPCDRYDKLVLLKEADETYRRNFELYDNAVAPTPGQPATAVADLPPTADNDPAKAAAVADQITAARKSLSKWRKAFAKLAPSDPRRDDLINKMREAVGLVTSAGGSFSAASRKDFAELGILTL